MMVNMASSFEAYSILFFVLDAAGSGVVGFAVVWLATDAVSGLGASDGKP